MEVYIKEGNTGILYFAVNGRYNKKHTYIPYKNLDEAFRCLDTFYTIKNSEGTPVKNAFREWGINWFPTTVSFLFWHCFYPYIQYRDFLHSYPRDKYTFRFENRGRLRRLIDLLYPSNTVLFRKRMMSYIWTILSFIHNKTVLKQNRSCKLLFFRYGLNDFRTAEIKKTIDELGIDYIEVAQLSLSELLNNLISLCSRPIYSLHNWSGKPKAPNYDVPDFIPAQDRIIFHAAIRACHSIIDGFKRTYKICKKELKGSRVKKLYGIDDANFLYPLLYACKDSKIRTIGHQHGLCYCPHHAAYMMKGFSRGEYQWFNHVLVWGKYFKDFMEKNAPCYPEGFFQIGTNKNMYQPKSESVCGSQGTKNILVPYEFLADTHAIGQYIIALQDLGYTIFFKTRSDEEVLDQIESYCLPEERKKQLVIVEEINDELMGKIDFIAGTQTVLIYDLFPYKKETWVLETEFRMLDHLAELGIAKKIRLDHIEKDVAQPFNNGVDQDFVNYVFSMKPLKEVLKAKLGV